MEHHIRWTVGGALFGFGLGSIGEASMTYTIDCYREARILPQNISGV